MLTAEIQTEIAEDLCSLDFVRERRLRLPIGPRGYVILVFTCVSLQQEEMTKNPSTPLHDREMSSSWMDVVDSWLIK